METDKLCMDPCDNCKDLEILQHIFVLKYLKIYFSYRNNFRSTKTHAFILLSFYIGFFYGRFFRSYLHKLVKNLDSVTYQNLSVSKTFVA